MSDPANGTGSCTTTGDRRKRTCADGRRALRRATSPCLHPLRLLRRAAPFDRLLLTGAAGGLGRVLRPRLRALARVLRVERRRRDGRCRRRRGGRRRGARRTRAAVECAGRRLRGDRPPRRHLTEGPFAPILQANIVGVWNLYEAARRHGVRRVVFASSNHVTGFYRQDEVVAPHEPMRPDGHYGLSARRSARTSRFYFDRYGIETVCLRIGSSFPEPKDRRMLATWLSYDDLERLVVAALTAPVVGHSVVYGCPTTRAPGGTTRRRATSAIGRGQLGAVSRRRRGAPAAGRSGRSGRRFQGGAFVAQGPFE